MSINVFLMDMQQDKFLEINFHNNFLKKNLNLKNPEILEDKFWQFKNIKLIKAKMLVNV